MGLSSLQIGTAGEHVVISKLLLNGFNPAKLEVDTGIDLILENGKTIQVKSVSKSRTKKRYSLRIRPWTRNNNTGKYKKKNEFFFADYLIAWLIDDNVFYIIPKKEIINHKFLSFHFDHKGKWSKYKENWQVLRGDLSS